jgi:tetratricopeptide (TPR) repeat protein
MLASNTNLDKCYQLLGLDREASLDRVKSAYRSLARKFHPDLNPHDVQAHQRFITLNQAYQLLLDSLPSHSSPPASSGRSTTSHSTQPQTAYPSEVKTSTPASTQQEEELKWELYYELQSLLKKKQFLKAIVLIEGLAQRFSLDLQICQWQGIIYSQFGNELVKQRDFDKARIYLKKALRVDPHNRELVAEVDRTLTRIAKLS